MQRTDRIGGSQILRDLRVGRRTNYSRAASSSSESSGQSRSALSHDSETGQHVYGVTHTQNHELPSSKRYLSNRGTKDTPEPEEVKQPAEIEGCARMDSIVESAGIGAISSPLPILIALIPGSV